MKQHRRLRLFLPQLRPELQLPSELSETWSGDTQVAAPLPAPVVAVVVAVVAVVDVAAVAVVDVAAAVVA